MKKLSVKERIIETASQLFYFQGFNQTGINQIIAEAGVAKASMYQHFRSKEDIAVTYLKKRHITWTNKLEDFVSQEKLPQEKIFKTFDFLIDWLSSVDFRGCGWQNIVTDLPNDHDKIRQQAVLHKNELRAWLNTNINQIGNYTSKEAKTLADEVLILIEGAIIQSQIQKDIWPINSAKNICKKILI
ncbi:TetR/AcrR family transcriptional regulator [Postechiella marina]|uniref:TetR/AcrR family transcriptional regulator n=1 Tax=Postechiella marina TaxID=943941 RepID=A0ABP8CEF3_9FLAO